MEAAADQIRQAYAKGNARERQQIQEQIRELQKDIYSDWEMIFSLAMAVSPLYLLHAFTNPSPASSMGYYRCRYRSQHLYHSRLIDNTNNTR